LKIEEKILKIPLSLINNNVATHKTSKSA